MPLSSDQKQAIKSALDRHLSACPICHSRTWLLGDDLVFLPTVSADSVDLGSGQPCASAICKTCGSVQVFNIFVLGLGEKLGMKPTGGSSG